MNVPSPGQRGDMRLPGYRNPLRLLFSAGLRRAAWYLAGYVFGTSYREISGTGMIGRAKGRWRDPATWRDVGYVIGLWCLPRGRTLRSRARCSAPPLTRWLRPGRCWPAPGPLGPLQHSNR